VTEVLKKVSAFQELCLSPSLRVATKGTYGAVIFEIPVFIKKFFVFFLFSNFYFLMHSNLLYTLHLVHLQMFSTF